MLLSWLVNKYVFNNNNNNNVVVVVVVVLLVVVVVMFNTAVVFPFQFWDTRSPNPMLTINLPERAYCADVVSTEC